MTSEKYRLVIGKIYLTNTHFYEKHHIKNMVLQKILPFIIMFFGATKIYEVVLKYTESQKPILILFLILFMALFSIGVYMFYDAFYKLSWKTKHSIIDARELIMDHDGDETDLKIKLKNGKKVWYSFRTLEKEHLRFISDLNSKKASELKITENERI
jgi:hypothetical protein